MSPVATNGSAITVPFGDRSPVGERQRRDRALLKLAD
jgi:hypothetical protein